MPPRRIIDSVPRGIARPGSRAYHTTDIGIVQIDLIGVPLDFGQGRRGVDMGPSAIRYAGMQTTMEALGHSCNIAFGHIGVNMTRKTFVEYFKAFGFLEKTGVDLPGEASGLGAGDGCASAVPGALAATRRNRSCAVCFTLSTISSTV